MDQDRRRSRTPLPEEWERPTRLTDRQKQLLILQLERSGLLRDVLRMLADAIDSYRRDRDRFLEGRRFRDIEGREQRYWEIMGAIEGIRRLGAAWWSMSQGDPREHLRDREVKPNGELPQRGPRFQGLDDL